MREREREEIVAHVIVVLGPAAARQPEEPVLAVVESCLHDAHPFSNRRSKGGKGIDPCHLP